MKGAIAFLMGLAAGLAQAWDHSCCATGIEGALCELNPKKPIAGRLVSAQYEGLPPSGSKVMAAIMAFEQGQRQDLRWGGMLTLVNTPTLQLPKSRRFEIAQDALTEVGDASLRPDTAP